MSLPVQKSVVLLVACALVVAGTAGVAGAVTHGGTAGQTETSQTGAAQASPESTCAAEPPADHDDPDADVLGWENGTWHDESLAVDQSDGVNASEQAAIVDRTKARLEAIRCVEFTESVPVTVISRTAFGELQRGGNVTAETTAELRAFDNAKLEALFLIGESEDSLEVQQRNRDVGVLGFYRNETGQLGYVWRLTWDSPQDAREFIDGYLQVLDYWGGEQVDPETYRIPAGGFEDAFHVSVDGRNVTIVNAPTVGQLNDVRMDVGNETADGNQTLGG
jgi:hypothetical protein